MMHFLNKISFPPSMDPFEHWSWIATCWTGITLYIMGSHPEKKRISYGILP
jgi:hypothetical protein